jgi:hypothetical protein
MILDSIILSDDKPLATGLRLIIVRLTSVL